jgi:hypothetical protein
VPHLFTELFYYVLLCVTVPVSALYWYEYQYSSTNVRIFFVVRGTSTSTRVLVDRKNLVLEVKSVKRISRNWNSIVDTIFPWTCIYYQGWTWIRTLCSWCYYCISRNWNSNVLSLSLLVERECGLLKGGWHHFPIIVYLGDWTPLLRVKNFRDNILTHEVQD